MSTDGHDEVGKMQGTFEDSLRVLLNRAYTPPTYNPAFRDSLLDNLKARQKQLVVESKARRRRKVVYLVSSVTAIAAAFVFTIAPAFLTTEPSGGDEEVFVKNAGVERPEPQPHPAILAKAIGPLEIQYKQSGEWTTVEKEADLRLEDGVRIRHGGQSDHPTGVSLANGTRLAMTPGSSVLYRNQGIELESGYAILVVSDNAEVDAAKLRFSDYTVAVNPGGKVFVERKDAAAYAPGGAPAPMVAVLRGTATVENAQGIDHLKEGFQYTLDRYVTARLPGRPFDALNKIPGFNPADIETPSLPDVVTVDLIEKKKK